MKSFSFSGLLFCLTTGFVPVVSFSPMGRPSTLPTKSRVALQRSFNDEDSVDKASPLELTAHDMARLTRLQECRVQMPILILDAMLPGQELTFESHDPKFHKLFDYCLETGTELGMLGLNQMTGRPLNRGVTVDLTDSPAIVNPVTQSVRVAVTGEKRFEIQGEPYLDESGTFYMADVEIVEDRYEPITSQQKSHAVTLSDTLPELMQEWTQAVLKAGVTDKTDLQRRLESMGPDMPDGLTERALWVASMLCPVNKLDESVCLEIRPAMLVASNDYDRTILAVQAVQSSIDHLTGKVKLF